LIGGAPVPPHARELLSLRAFCFVKKFTRKTMRSAKLRPAAELTLRTPLPEVNVFKKVLWEAII